VRSVRRFTAFVLLLNSLFEIGAGVLILVSPSAVFPAAGPHAAAVARTLAGAAIAAGSLSLVLLVAYQPGLLFRSIMWILALFHVLLAAMHGLASIHGFTVITAPLAHFALAVLFTVALVTSRSKGRTIGD
jgi:hypothetical protein